MEKSELKALLEQVLTRIRQARTIETEVDKRVKAKTSGASLPGTTPGPANSNIRFFTRRGRPTDATGQPDSRAGRAATALDRLTARRADETA